MTKVRPCNDYVLVERFKAPSILDSGLIVPDKAKPLLCRGRVIAVGPGRYDQKTKKRIYTNEIKPGDEIIWVQAGVEKWKDAERTPHIFVEYNYILAVVNEKDAGGIQAA